MLRPAVVFACLVALVSGACAKGDVAPLPKPPKPPETSSSLPPVDMSGAPLPPVRGATTTTVPPVVGGEATLAGTIVGPEGPVPGAIVHAERLVGDAFGVLEVTTGEDGKWAMEGILGGRYRLRAWKPAPDNLAVTQAEVFFLSSDEKR
ncbi:MAG: carboxypeptidase-like regulatory domain-containing protein, partial [Acidimicrobiia bacterium]